MAAGFTLSDERLDEFGFDDSREFDSTVQWPSLSSDIDFSLEWHSSCEDSSAAALNGEWPSSCEDYSAAALTGEDFQLVPCSEKSHAKEEELQFQGGQGGENRSFLISHLRSGEQDCLTTPEGPSSSSHLGMIELSSNVHVFSSPIREDFQGSEKPHAKEALGENEFPTLPFDALPFDEFGEDCSPTIEWPSSSYDDVEMITSITQQDYSAAAVLDVVEEEETQLPSGCYFRPTPKDLLIDYLDNKENSRTLPTNFVKDCDVYNFEPWLLPGADMILAGMQKSLYFFVNLRKTSLQGSRSHRSKPGQQGFWRASTGDKHVTDVTYRQGKVIIGVFKQLSYHIYADASKPTCKGSKKTEWIMHEYRKEKGSSLQCAKSKSADNNLTHPDMDWNTQIAKD